MFLTEATQVKVLANGRVVVFDGTKVAQFVSADQVGVCGDLYHGYPRNLPAEAEWCPDSPSDLIQSCEGQRVHFDNGSLCEYGCVHFANSEYFDDQEVAAMLRSGNTLPANARRMDGAPIWS